MGMLILHRSVNEAVRIGEDVWVTVLRVEHGKVRLGIAAPPEVAIWREELIKGEGPPPDYRAGRRETVRPDSDLARALPLQPESPAEQESDD
jgi:carbon storage regulator